jgi:DhnA family fructose-bisphosphate aldolase class Ia
LLDWGISILSYFGKQIRLHRILGGEKHKPLIVAFDHALPLGPIPGTVNPADQVEAFAKAGVDAVLLNPGMICHCVNTFLQPYAPSLIVRMDWSSLWTSFGFDYDPKSRSIATPEQALRHGADAVLSYLLIGTGDVEFEADEIARNARLARECEQLGIPLIVESLARGKNVNSTSPAVLKLHTRIAAELGADVIKTEYTGDPQTMADVVESCPLPILTLGGARKNSDTEALAILREVLSTGVRGVFVGRFAFQSSDVASFLRQVRTLLDQAPPKCHELFGAQ